MTLKWSNTHWRTPNNYTHNINTSEKNLNIHTHTLSMIYWKTEISHPSVCSQRHRWHVWIPGQTQTCFMLFFCHRTCVTSLSLCLSPGKLPEQVSGYLQHPAGLSHLLRPLHLRGSIHLHHPLPGVEKHVDHRHRYNSGILCGHRGGRGHAAPFQRAAGRWSVCIIVKIPIISVRFWTAPSSEDLSHIECVLQLCSALTAMFSLWNCNKMCIKRTAVLSLSVSETWQTWMAYIWYVCHMLHQLKKHEMGPTDCSVHEKLTQTPQSESYIISVL